MVMSAFDPKRTLRSQTLRMNLEELRARLHRAGVHPGLYSLGAPASESESYSLLRDGTAWKVLYKERGQFAEIGSALSESEGCLLLYQLLNEALSLGGPSQGREG